MQDITGPAGPVDKNGLELHPSAANVTVKRSLISWEIKDKGSGPFWGNCFPQGAPFFVPGDVVENLGRFCIWDNDSSQLK